VILFRTADHRIYFQTQRFINYITLRYIRWVRFWLLFNWSIFFHGHHGQIKEQSCNKFRACCDCWRENLLQQQ